MGGGYPVARHLFAHPFRRKCYTSRSSRPRYTARNMEHHTCNCFAPLHRFDGALTHTHPNQPWRDHLRMQPTT